MLSAPARPADPRVAATPPPVPPETMAAPPAVSRPWATIALAVLTAASAAGLTRVFSGHSWLGPVAITIATVHVWCWTLRRWRVGHLLSAVLALAVVALLMTWTVLGRYTVYGLPSPDTWHHATAALGDLHNEIASLVAPVPLTRAFELLAVAGAGVAAALGDWAAFRWKMPMAALVPGLAVFIFCCSTGSGRGRGPLVGVEVAALCLFLLVERASRESGEIWFAGTRAGVGPWVAVTGGVVTAAAVVTAMALSPALPRRDGAGVLGWRGGLGPSGGERIVPNPLVDFRAQLTQLANTPAFVVTSSVPSYWRLTSLDTFDGSDWKSTGSYRGFGSRLPGAPPAGLSFRTAQATFRIQELASVWLPAQFDPVSVQGLRRVTYDPASNSLLTSGTTSPGQRYSVTSYQNLATIDAADLSAAPPLGRDAVTMANTQLPPTLDARIIGLAAAVTGRAKSEYAKALAIQNFLRGPEFTYSLNPPVDGSGQDALDSFLFGSRQGYCQQFAGAFAVMARIAGLPTRLAVGFVTGEATTGGAYQVRDKDLHTWPEVWFGARIGWVPFEPTKGFGDLPGSSGYMQISGGSSGRGPSSTPTVPSTAPNSTGPTTPDTIRPSQRAVPSTGAVGTATPSSGGASLWWLAIPGMLMLWLATNGAGPVLLRHLRRRRAAQSGPGAVVLNTWAEVTSDLEWQGIHRRPDETDDEFARRASSELRMRGVAGTWSYGGLGALAALARRAAFAPSVPEGLGEQAAVTAAEIEAQLREITPTSRRLARAWMPRPGAWARLVDGLRPGGRRADRSGGGRADRSGGGRADRPGAPGVPG